MGLLQLVQALKEESARVLNICEERSEENDQLERDLAEARSRADRVGARLLLADVETAGVIAERDRLREKLADSWTRNLASSKESHRLVGLIMALSRACAAEYREECDSWGWTVPSGADLAPIFKEAQALAGGEAK